MNTEAESDRERRVSEAVVAAAELVEEANERVFEASRESGMSTTVQLKLTGIVSEQSKRWRELVYRQLGITQQEAHVILKAHGFLDR